MLNFFVDIPDDYKLTVGNLRAIVNDAPTAECFTCGMERVKDEKYGSLPTLVYDPEDVPDEVLEANDRLVSLADVCKLIKREWQINPHQWGELARLPSVECGDCIWSVCNYNKAFKDEPQTEDGEDYLRGYQDGYTARGVLDRAGVEIHIDKPRGYTLNTDTNDAWKPKTEPQTERRE